MENKPLSIKQQELLQILQVWMSELDINELNEMEPVNLDNPVKEVLSVREVACFLGVSMDTVYAMVKEKQIPYFRVRRRILFDRILINEWCRCKG
ncbi:helix-turn-helix domain-containing protein [Paenibacillus sp. FSL H7-0690]|uniref:helix-turn-helix domain-containing protein n=1 Tax=Paenibacillus sp. FSL H7-0690 TaxID=2921437 RepID=UPI0030EE25CF